MTDASQKLRALAEALQLCRHCDAQLTGIAHPRTIDPPLLDLPIPESSPQTDEEDTASKRSPTSHSPEIKLERPLESQALTTSGLPLNDVLYRRCFINNVRVVDSAFQSFTVQDCDLENVSFRSCSFTNVTFEDLKLKNVTFFNVDFDNLWLRDIKWICALWDGVGLANAVVSGYNFVRELEDGDEKRPKLVLPLNARPASTASKTVILHPSRASRAQALQDGESQIVCKAQKFDLLSLPDKIIDEILAELFPHGQDREYTIMLSDIPTAGRPNPSSQATYTLRSPFGFKSAPFTYHGWPHPSTTTVKDIEQDPGASLKFCVPFLQVSKYCYTLAARNIYNHRLDFNDKPERCIAFLQDHRAAEHKDLSIALRYSSQTDPAAWRQLFDVLLADEDAINELTVEISSEFWSSSIWRGKCWPETLIGWKGWYGPWQPLLSDPEDLEKSFLEIVARLPGTRLRDWKVPRKAEDVRFFLTIKAASGHPSREAFVDEVQMKLRIRMLLNSDK